MLNNMPYSYSIHSADPHAVCNLSSEIIKLVDKYYSPFDDLAVLCIGTDRSTGDCLGPLVGYKLTSSCNLNDVHILGTLDKPIHAKNLKTTIESIYSELNNPFLIAVDASLGRSENIGKINLYNGPLSPGSGVNKSLESVGNISLTGIVNVSGYMEYIVLQNTRLSIVMQLSEIIAASLHMSLLGILSDKETYRKNCFNRI